MVILLQLARNICQFLEQVHDQITRTKYKLMHKKKTIFYRESMVYPFVNMSEINGLYIISSRDFLSHYQELGCFKHEYPLYSMTTIIHQIITLKKLPNSKTTKIHSKPEKIFHLIISSWSFTIWQYKKSDKFFIISVWELWLTICLEWTDLPVSHKFSPISKFQPITDVYLNNFNLQKS